jgi:hypothetical protein
MSALVLAIGSWIMLSVVATPFIGRFMVMRDDTDELAPAGQAANPEIRQMPFAAVAAGRHQHTRRPYRVRSAAR